jgi:hypothetical protein
MQTKVYAIIQCRSVCLKIQIPQHLLVETPMSDFNKLCETVNVLNRTSKCSLRPI